MSKTTIVASTLLTATLFASLHSCKKKSDNTPSTRITSFKDSVVLTSSTSAVVSNQADTYTFPTTAITTLFVWTIVAGSIHPVEYQ